MYQILMKPAGKSFEVFLRGKPISLATVCISHFTASIGHFACTGLLDTRIG